MQWFVHSWIQKALKQAATIIIKRLFILTIKCGKDHCVVLKARHFSHLASFYSRPGFTKPHFTNLGFDTQGDEYG